MTTEERLDKPRNKSVLSDRDIDFESTIIDQLDCLNRNVSTLRVDIPALIRDEINRILREDRFRRSNYQ